MPSERCDYCLTRWDRPSLHCEAPHAIPTAAQMAALKIEDMLSSRRGFDFSSLDNDIHDEILDDMANIVRETQRSEYDNE